MRMRDIGTSLFRCGGRRSGLAVRPPAAMGTPQGTVLTFSAKRGLPAQVGTNYLKSA